MKPKYFLFLCLSFLILNSSLLIGTVRYVSKTGTSTPPYTSWATSADSIQKCINICSFGDTIYVANGVYKELIVMVPGLALIGAGMDSCVIDTKEMAFNGIKTIEVFDSCTVKGFKIIVAPVTGPSLGCAVFMEDSSTNCKIENNCISDAKYGVFATDGLIKKNIITMVDWGITFSAPIEFSNIFRVFIDSNIISFSVLGTFSLNSFIIQNVYMAGNIFFIDNPFPQSLPIFENTLSYTYAREFNNNRASSIVDSVQYEKGIINTLQGNFTNNVFLSKFENAFYTIPAASIKNNIIVGSANGVTSSNGIDVRFNNCIGSAKNGIWR